MSYKCRQQICDFAMNSKIILNILNEEEFPLYFADLKKHFVDTHTHKYNELIMSI